MTKLNKNQRAAVLAKKLGYTHIATVVKSHFDSTYYNVNDVDDVIKHGWTAATALSNGLATFNCGSGVLWHNTPAKTVRRQELFAKLDENDNQKYCTADFDNDTCSSCGECDK